jgi:hypothetical protein
MRGKEGRIDLDSTPTLCEMIDQREETIVKRIAEIGLVSALAEDRDGLSALSIRRLTSSRVYESARPFLPEI